jgi:hypothetical protein
MRKLLTGTLNRSKDYRTPPVVAPPQVSTFLKIIVFLDYLINNLFIFAGTVSASGI